MKRRTYTLACQGKRRLPPAGEAHLAARAVARREKVAGRRVGLYRCPYCQGWHVGGESDWR